MRPASLDPHRPCTAYFAGAGGERFSTQPGRNGNGSEILNHENASLTIQIIQNGGSNMFDSVYIPIWIGQNWDWVKTI